MLECKWWKILISICFLGSWISAKALNVDAGEDRKICKNGFAVLGGSPTASGGQAPYTFSWRTDTGGNFSNESNPSVFPSQTTTYTVVVVDANGVSCVASVTLTTVKVRLSVEADLTSCMEDRELTFFAIAEGLDIEDGPITYEFWHQEQPHSNNPIDYTYVTQETIDTMGGTILFMVKANPDDSACYTKLNPVFWNHAYTANDYVIARQGDFTCISDALSFDVHELSIEMVLDHASGNQDKVVVGKNIDYLAFASDDCDFWTWRMPDGPNGFVIDTCAEHPTPVVNPAWRPTGGNARSNTGLSSLDNGTPMVIPFGDLTISGTGNLRAHNNWFGDTYGLVEAYCLDAEDHFYHDFHRVEVFFDPDLDLFGDTTMNNPLHDPSAVPPIINTSTNTNEPCWFVFWKDGNVIDSIEHFVYVPNLPDYGLTRYIGGSPPPDTIEAHHLSMEIGPFTDEPKSANYNLTWSAANINVTLNHNLNHIQSVANTIKHEMHHRHIHFYWRPQNLSEQNSGTWDTDYLPQDEEENPGFYGYPGETYFVRSAPDTADTYNVKSFFPGSNYELYGDSELRCRMLAQTSPATIRFDDDWSMDQYNPKW